MSRVQHKTASNGKTPLLGHDIGLCLLPDRTWHKGNDTKVDYSGDFGEGKDGNELKLELYWTMLLIGPLSGMWVWLG